MDKKIKFKFWLALSEDGTLPRVTKGSPNLGWHERAMFMTVSVPVALFARPSLTAHIEVKDAGGVELPPIDVETTETALRQVLGTDVRIEIGKEQE